MCDYEAASELDINININAARVGLIFIHTLQKKLQIHLFIS